MRPSVSSEVSWRGLDSFFWKPDAKYLAKLNLKNPFLCQRVNQKVNIPDKNSCKKNNNYNNFRLLYSAISSRSQRFHISCKYRVLVRRLVPYLRHVLEIDMSSTIWTKEKRSNKNVLRHKDMSFSKSCLPTSDNRHVLRNWSALHEDMICVWVSCIETLPLNRSCIKTRLCISK